MEIVVKFGIYFLNILYALLKLFPVQRKIVMISRQSNDPSIDFMLLQEALMQEDNNLHIVLLCKTLDGGLKSTLLKKIGYGFHMVRQMYNMATSQVVVLDTYCITASLLHHRKKLKIIQMWHSIGTMKKFGYTALDTAEGSKSRIASLMQMHKSYSYVFASSPAYQKDLAAGFNCNENIVRIFPLPRVDLLKDVNFKKQMQNKIYQKYPELQTKKVIVYCPTFRKNESSMQAALDQLCNHVTDEVLVVKLHPLSKINVDNKHIVKAPEFSTFEMLFVADVVISDYSCVIYEAAVLQIPLYFYNFDMNKYTKNRGLAINYEQELPGIISRNAVVIMNAIKEKPYNMRELKDFCDKYVVYEGSASVNIAIFILKLMGK